MEEFDIEDIDIDDIDMEDEEDGTIGDFFLDALYSRLNFVHEDGEPIDKPWETEIDRVYTIGQYLNREDYEKSDIDSWINNLIDTFSCEAWLEPDELDLLKKEIFEENKDGIYDALKNIFLESVDEYLEAYDD